MSSKKTLKPIALTLGATFVTSLAATGIAGAADNPFGQTELSSGYMVADSKMEGKCGGAMKAKAGEAKSKMEGKCGEGKCGGATKARADEAKHDMEGKCGAGMKEKAAEAKSKMKEGKCGEGKCGGMKK